MATAQYPSEFGRKTALFTIRVRTATTAGLLELIQTSTTEFMVVSAVGNHTCFYGEDLPELLQRRIELTQRHRHHLPRTDRDILWRPIPGTTSPEGWA